MEPGEGRVALITASSQEEALKIAKALVAEKLAACVNLVPGVRSIYSWEGKLCDDQEILLIAKTSAAKFPPLAERVKSLHSYQVPEVIALPISQGSEKYLAWMKEALEG